MQCMFTIKCIPTERLVEQLFFVLHSLCHIHTHCRYFHRNAKINSLFSSAAAKLVSVCLRRRFVFDIKLT